MRTKVKLINTPYQCRLKKDDTGYIDGYVRGGNDVPLAAVVSNGIIDLVPIYMLAVLSE